MMKTYIEPEEETLTFQIQEIFPSFIFWKEQILCEFVYPLNELQIVDEIRGIFYFSSDGQY